MKQCKLFFVTGISLFFLFSCMSPRQPVQTTSRYLLAPGIKSVEQLATFFVAHNPQYPKNDITRLAQYYVSEAAVENINADVAFVQMCLETGWLRFGNLVTPEMHNYCGLGAIDAAHPGEYFATEQLGVRAHIQHLQAYATTEQVPLKQALVDPRYTWVHKAKYAQTAAELAGHWAADPQYGIKLERLLSELDAY